MTVKRSAWKKWDDLLQPAVRAEGAAVAAEELANITNKVCRPPGLHPLMEAPAKAHTLAPVTEQAEMNHDMLLPLGRWREESAGWTKIRSVMDSGAIASVIPPDAIPAYGSRPSPGRKRGQQFTSAAGTVIPNEGEQVLPAVTPTGARTILKKQLAAVTMPLDSVWGVLRRWESGHLRQVRRHDREPQDWSSHSFPTRGGCISGGALDPSSGTG